MAKRRTKKQKIKAQARRHVEINEQGYSFSEVEIPDKKVVAQKPTQTTAIEKDHSYVFAETKKTLVILTSLIVAQLILAALIKTNVINLPF